MKLKRQLGYWISLCAGVCGGCNTADDDWKPISPRDVGSPPAELYRKETVPPRSLTPAASTGAAFRFQPVSWRIPATGNGRFRSRQRLYLRPQPELETLPQTGAGSGAAQPGSSLFPAL